MISCLRGFDKKAFIFEDRQAHETLKEMTSSKKDEVTRRQENSSFVLKPVTTFLEERLPEYLLDNKFTLLGAIMTAIVESDDQSRFEDFLDEFYRQIQKKVSFGAEGKGLVLAHPDTHRMLRGLVGAEAETEHGLRFSKQLLDILMKDLESTLRSRAAFILMEYLQHESTRRLALKPLLKHKQLV